MLRPVMGGYGLGFGVDPPGTFGHGGSNAGFKAQLLATVEGGRAVVVMTNGDRGSSLAAEIIRAIRAEYAWPEPGGS
jgi:hypothetical protein